MTFKIPHNLQAREAAVLAVYPGMAIGTIGNAAHLAEHSDHNEDARGVEHALDFMTQAYEHAHGLLAESVAAALLAWFTAWHDDAEYWIHDRYIYDRAHNFTPRPYTGSDPHTDHVHFSGRHGPTGADAETGTGYDVAAEQMTPPPLEDDMPTAQEIAAAVWAFPLGNKETAGGNVTDIHGRSAVLNTLPSLLAGLPDKVVAGLPAGGDGSHSTAEVVAAVQAAIAGMTATTTLTAGS